MNEPLSQREQWRRECLALDGCWVETTRGVFCVPVEVCWPNPETMRERGERAARSFGWNGEYGVNFGIVRTEHDVS